MRPALKRLASGVQVPLWPPSFHQLTSTPQRSFIPFHSKTFGPTGLPPWIEVRFGRRFAAGSKYGPAIFFEIHHWPRRTWRRAPFPDQPLCHPVLTDRTERLQRPVATGVITVIAVVAGTGQLDHRHPGQDGYYTGRVKPEEGEQ